MSLLNSYVETLIPSVMESGGHEVGVLTNGIRALVKRPQGPLFPFLCADTAKDGCP